MKSYCIIYDIRLEMIGKYSWSCWDGTCQRMWRSKHCA